MFRPKIEPIIEEACTAAVNQAVRRVWKHRDEPAPSDDLVLQFKVRLEEALWEALRERFHFDDSVEK